MDNIDKPPATELPYLRESVSPSDLLSAAAALHEAGPMLESIVPGIVAMVGAKPLPPGTATQVASRLAAFLASVPHGMTIALVVTPPDGPATTVVRMDVKETEEPDDALPPVDCA